MANGFKPAMDFDKRLKQRERADAKFWKQKELNHKKRFVRTVKGSLIAVSVYALLITFAVLHHLKNSYKHNAKKLELAKQKNNHIAIEKYTLRLKKIKDDHAKNEKVFNAMYSSLTPIEKVDFNIRKTQASRNYLE